MRSSLFELLLKPLQYYGLVPKLLQTVSHAALMFAFYEKAGADSKVLSNNSGEPS